VIYFGETQRWTADQNEEFKDEKDREKPMEGTCKKDRENQRNMEGHVHTAKGDKASEVDRSASNKRTCRQQWDVWEMGSTQVSQRV